MNDDFFSPEVNKLLEELNISRGELEKYIIEVEGLRTKVCKLFPEQLDYRNQRLMDEKIKIFSEFFNTLLKLRQEKHKLLLDEIRIRNDKKMKDDSPFDVRAILKEIKEEGIKNE